MEKYTDEKLQELWDELRHIPFDEDDNGDMIISDSMRWLLKTIKNDGEFVDARFIGDFDENDMTEDGKIAWGTPIRDI